MYDNPGPERGPNLDSLPDASDVSITLHAATTVGSDLLITT
jgi:hypothetical protein